MQLFNGLNMRILGLYKINNEENPSEKPSAETYANSQNAQLNKIKKEISELTDTLDDGSFNTSNDKIEIQWELTTEFANYLKSNKDVAIALNDAVKEVDYNNLDEDNKKAVDNLKKFLEPIVNKSFSDTYNISELNTMQPPKNDEKGDFANWVDKAPDWSESEVKELLVDINTKFSEYESILNDENNKDVKTILEKVKMVLENPVERNVKILQKVIYDNLDDWNKNKFLQENKNKKNYNDSDMFDWKFWKYMVVWTKKWLNIIEDNLKKLKGAQDVISESEKNNLLWKIKPDIVADANSDPKNWFDDLPEWTDVKFKDDSEKAKLNTVWDNTEIKLIVTTNGASEEISVKVKVVEKVQTNPKISESLKVGDVEYPIVNPQNVKNLPQMKWATFYLTTEIASPAPKSWEQWQQSPEIENGERVFYLKFGNWDLFKVKVDNDWNLCPVATKINDKNPKETVTLIKNNKSCINYLKNKLPSAIANNVCVIWWNDNLQDYTLTSYWRTLTIEPMTIAWNWISKDLWKNLAFLNLTNYVRSLWNKKDKDPDVNKKLRVKWLKDSNGKKLFIDKQSFGLEGAEDDELKKFKEYNNHEDWGDKWDKKPENKNYTKVDFPDIVVNNSETLWTIPGTSTETETGTSTETETGRKTVENLNSQNLRIDWVWYMDDGEFKFNEKVEQNDVLNNSFINYWENKYYELDQNDTLVSDWLYYTLIKNDENWPEPIWIVLWKIGWNKYVWDVTVMNGNYKYEWTVDGVYTNFNIWKMTFPNWNTFQWNFDWESPEKWRFEISDKWYDVKKQDDGRLLIINWDDAGKYIDMKSWEILNS